MSDEAEAPTHEQRRRNPERVPAFVDATIAIVMTILVLEIGVPSDLSEQSLREALEEVGPTLIAWVISFMLVGMYWVWHRDVFTNVREVNRDLIWLNLLFLLPVSLVPFAAAVLGDYHGEAIALHLYGAVLIAVSLMRIAIYWYATGRPDLLWEPVDRGTRRLGLKLALIPIAFYGVAMIVADWSHQLSLTLYFAVPGAYFVAVTVLRDRPATADEVRDVT